MKNMKKLNKIMYGLLFLLLAATTSTFTSCRDEASVDPYFVASEADIELQYDGLTEKKQPGQFKMGGANLCCSSFRLAGSVTLLGIFITWRPPKKLSVIEL